MQRGRDVSPRRAWGKAGRGLRQARGGGGGRYPEPARGCVGGAGLPGVRRSRSGAARWRSEASGGQDRRRPRWETGPGGS